MEASTRVVFVLGRRARLDAGTIEAATVGVGGVVVLSLGYPVSRAQRRAVDAALEMAGPLGVTVDAVLVTDPGDLRGLVGTDGEVVVAGSRRERRHLRRRLAQG